MFKKLSEWFQSQLDDPKQSSPAHTVELATAVLLFEVIKADGEIDQQEQLRYRELLTERFSLSTQEVDELLQLTREKADYAADFQQFTRVLNDQCSAEDKIEILDALWTVAFADKNLDPIEEHMIRKIADLLYIPHSQYIKSKLRNSQGEE